MEKIIIKNSFCAWIDLLGYGAAFYQNDWDLHAPEAVNNLYRIKELEPILHSISNPFCETLFSLNDGIIRNFDIPQNDALLIMQWLVDVLLKFKTLNDRDIHNGFYGGIRLDTVEYRNLHARFLKIINNLIEEAKLLHATAANTDDSSLAVECLKCVYGTFSVIQVSR